jgi:predicted HTH domain antitoxin
MNLKLQLSDATASALHEALGPDLNRAALEALVVEAYRQGKLSLGALAESLGMGVIEADAWLGRRGIPLNYTAEDLQADCDTLRRLIPNLPK